MASSMTRHHICLCPNLNSAQRCANPGLWGAPQFPIGKSNLPHVPIRQREGKSTKKTHLLYDHELQETNMLYRAIFMSTSSPMGIPPSWFPMPAAGYTQPIHTLFPILPFAWSYTTAFHHFGTYRCLCIAPVCSLSTSAPACPLQALRHYPRAFRTYKWTPVLRWYEPEVSVWRNAPLRHICKPYGPSPHHNAYQTSSHSRDWCKRCTCRPYYIGVINS